MSSSSSPPRHRVDRTLQAMEQAHRSTPEDQVQNFAQSIRTAQVAFEKFANTQENESSIPSTTNSLYALVEAENSADHTLDQRLEQVKESLAQMERKRMLALGAVTRLNEENVCSQAFSEPEL